MQSIERSFERVKAAIVAELRSDSEMLEDHIALLQMIWMWCEQEIDYTETVLAEND